MVRAMISAGSAVDLRAPDGATAWGWRADEEGRCRPLGLRIGWIHGDDLYLDVTSAYRVAEQMSGEEGIPLRETTLVKRLHEMVVHLVRPSHDPVGVGIEGSLDIVVHVDQGDELA